MNRSISAKLVDHTTALIRDFQNDLDFSLHLALIRAAEHISLSLLHIDGFGTALFKRRQSLIMTMLRRDLAEIIERYHNLSDVGEHVDDAPIWVCWWQGMEQAPHIVQRCIESIQSNACGHEVIIVDKYNYSKYVSIPKQIVEAVDDSRICFANFSDYIRFALLYRWGGVWIDSTVFVSGEIPESVYDYRYYSLKSSDYDAGYLLYCSGRWVTYLIGGYKKAKLFAFICDCLSEYWHLHHTIIDYELTDWLIQIAITEYPDISIPIRDIPINNTNRQRLNEALDCDAPASRWHDYVKQDTIFYKLTYKNSHSLSTREGLKTIYAALLDGSYKDF